MLEGFIDVPTVDHVLHTAISHYAPSTASPSRKPSLHFITNLPNRAGLLHQLQHSSQDSVLSGSRLLLSVRLTNPKYLQSSAGHSAVARALHQIAQSLRSLVRRSDLREQADRAALLTRELLAFARRQSLQPRAIDLNAVNRGLTSFLDKVISKDIEIKVDAGVLHPIKADPTQIEQVLMNLCLNARDAMPNGGRLLIETEMVPIDDSYCHFYPYVIPGLYAVLSVSDTGVGMEPEVRERIFEPFFTTKENGKGTGLGLVTAYGIVKQLGGFIHVYSEPRHGTLFRVYLPAMEGAAAESSAPVHDSTPTSPLHGSETILLAEDHDSIREMVRQSLVNYGYRVLSAEDGEQALRLCEREAPDLAVLDLVMPHLGGPAAALRLRERYPRLHVLFTSGYSESSAGALAQVPDSRYLQKPYSPTSLGRILREILGPSLTPDLFSATSARRG